MDIFRDNKLVFEKVFDTSLPTIARSKFLSCLSKHKINTAIHEITTLSNGLALQNNNNMINLEEFEYLIRNYETIFNEIPSVKNNINYKSIIFFKL